MNEFAAASLILEILFRGFKAAERAEYRAWRLRKWFGSHTLLEFQDSDGKLRLARRYRANSDNGQDHWARVARKISKRPATI